MRCHSTLDPQRLIQRCTPPPILQVGLGTLEQQVDDGLVLAVLGSQHKGGAAVVVGRVEIGTAEPQQPDDGQIALPRRLAQALCRRPFWEGDVLTGQQPHHLRLVLLDGVQERLPAPAVLRVGVGPRVEQHGRDLAVALRAGGVQRTALVVVPVVGVHLAVQQRLHRRRVPREGHVAQRGAAALVHRRLRPPSGQQLRHRLLVRQQRHLQRGAPPAVGEVDVDALPEKRLDGRLEARLCHDVQRRLPVVVGGVDVQPHVHHAQHLLSVAHHRRVHQRGERGHVGAVQRRLDEPSDARKLRLVLIAQVACPRGGVDLPDAVHAVHVHDVLHHHLVLLRVQVGEPHVLVAR
mmetsp:Transcript_12534/g.26411  ORF Transcript_12534/g.26411 Transcript_12534/m.26411 type:complete len:349 (+) Transcript_12534:6723-7769(+)